MPSRCNPNGEAVPSPVARESWGGGLGLPSRSSGLLQEKDDLENPSASEGCEGRRREGLLAVDEPLRTAMRVFEAAALKQFL